MSDSITFLGTADGLANASRNHASLLARLAGRTILLDAGQPCSQTLKRIGAGFGQLDAIIITHVHSDHIGGLPMLLQSMWLDGRRRELPIWLPREVIAPLRAWLDACHLFAPRLGFRVHWRPISSHTIRIGNVRLRAVRNSHLDSTRAKYRARYPGVSCDAFSLLLRTPRCRVAYSADIGGAEDLRALCREPLDLLVTELAHFEPQRLLDVLPPGRVRHLAVTHVGREIAARLHTVKRILARAPVGRITCARDGLTLTCGR
jgi:ribonuclease Z